MQPDRSVTFKVCLALNPFGCLACSTARSAVHQCALLCGPTLQAAGASYSGPAAHSLRCLQATNTEIAQPSHLPHKDQDEQQRDSRVYQELAAYPIDPVVQSWPRAKISQVQAENSLSYKPATEAATKSQKPAKVKPGKKEDLLIVMPSNIDRMPIVAASRGWRQGVKTYVTFEQEVDLATSSHLFKVLVPCNSCSDMMPSTRCGCLEGRSKLWHCSCC